MSLGSVLQGMISLSQIGFGSLGTGLLTRNGAYYRESNRLARDASRLIELRDCLDTYRNEAAALAALRHAEGFEARELKCLITPSAGQALAKVVSTVDAVRPHVSPIPAGQHIVGEEDGAHWVEFPAFFMANTPVTKGQYLELAKTCGLMFRHHYFKPPNDDCPMLTCSWHTAHEYAAWLTVLSGALYRLPMEEEWERAARGDPVILNGQLSELSPEEFLSRYWDAQYENGFLPEELDRLGLGAQIIHDHEVLIKLMRQGVTVSAYHMYGTQDGALSDWKAWWNRAVLQKIAQYPANSLGLYDMSGNTYEMTVGKNGVPVLKGGYFGERDKWHLRAGSRIEFSRIQQYKPLAVTHIRKLLALLHLPTDTPVDIDKSQIPSIGFRLLFETDISDEAMVRALVEVIEGAQRHSSIR
jgi:formylglycine-generating enzyme required for sulfatase activity